MTLDTAARGSSKDAAAPLLKAAIRRARLEEAERSDVLAELRGAEIARLEMLQDAIEPVLAEVPSEADLFDTGLLPAAHPRLFIDMIGFVEMGRDRRLYRFVQDTKYGRVVLAESDKIDVMVKAITDYIARRLVEREKALASDSTIAAGAGAAKLSQPAQAAAPTRKKRQGFHDILGFTIELLGSMALFILIAAGCYYFLTLFASWSALLHKN
jgi:hypothetical protein